MLKIAYRLMRFTLVAPLVVFFIPVAKADEVVKGLLMPPFGDGSRIGIYELGVPDDKGNAPIKGQFAFHVGDKTKFCLDGKDVDSPKALAPMAMTVAVVGSSFSASKVSQNCPE